MSGGEEAAAHMTVTVYSTSYCGFCHRAEGLLRQRGIPFTRVDVTNDPRMRDELVDRAHGRRTVPVIFFDDEPIGGYRELAILDATGELARRVEEAQPGGAGAPEARAETAAQSRKT
jgi:glutaredoxin 3